MKLNKFIPEYLDYIESNLKPKTVKEYRRLLDKIILPKFGKIDMEKVKTADLEKWHICLRKETPAQANRALAVISAVFRLAARWEYIDVSPAHGIQYSKEVARESYFSPEQRQRFLGIVYQQPPVDCSYLLTLFYTGARPGELKEAKWEWFKGTTLELPDSKTGRRTIYLPPEAQKAIEALRASSTTEFIFPGVSPSILWRRVRSQGDFGALRLYDLRHTFASAALEAGAPLEAISQLLGHKNPQTTRRYTHLSKDAGLNTATLAEKVLASGSQEKSEQS